MAPIPSSTRKITYNPIASTGPFPVGSPAFPIFDPVGADLLVTLDGVVATGWTFSGVLESGFYGAPNTYTGSISFATPITGALVIKGKRAPRRQAQYGEGRGIPAKDHNAEYNVLTATDQELRRDVDDISLRALRVPDGETVGDLPAVIDRAGKVLGFDELGRPAPYVTDPIPLAQPGVDTVGTLELKINSIEEENYKTGSVSNRAMGLLAVALANIDFTNMRLPCQGNVDLYVSVLGNDANTGTLASPLRTGNEAWRRLRDHYDGRGAIATIWIMGLGNTPIDVTGHCTTFLQVFIQGYGTDLATDATWVNVGFADTGTNAIKLGKNAQAWVRGLTVANSAGHGLVAWWSGSILEYSSIRFGQCEPSSGNHIWATQGGQIEGYGYSVIHGGAGSHIQASHGGRFRSTTQVTYAGAPITFGLTFAYALNGEIVLTGTPPLGGAFNPNGFTVNGPPWYRVGYAGAIQAYGLQTPTAGDFMGISGGGGHGPNT